MNKTPTTQALLYALLYIRRIRCPSPCTAARDTVAQRYIWKLEKSERCHRAQLAFLIFSMFLAICSHNGQYEVTQVAQQT